MPPQSPPLTLSPPPLPQKRYNWMEVIKNRTGHNMKLSFSFVYKLDTPVNLKESMIQTLEKK